MYSIRNSLVTLHSEDCNSMNTPKLSSTLPLPKVIIKVRNLFVLQYHNTIPGHLCMSTVPILISSIVIHLLTAPKIHLHNL